MSQNGASCIVDGVDINSVDDDFKLNEMVSFWVFFFHAPAGVLFIDLKLKNNGALFRLRKQLPGFFKIYFLLISKF